ncbi:OLC1v1028200C1 [Oldenlandia corymbosa var. corymbosa]|uniref:OLC1v1028200C1 n=1 Tax=Oldenlandia corymbosa var. corymbosa TaxID=529605 RepID=A0AAV1CD10_OLDCO|nr:OLC1v1028200C1 [Oldenlandia corymbosa var. corymbosa]
MEIAAPYAAMVVAQTAQVGLIIVSKEAMSNGMSNFISVSYSNALAALILLPVSFFIHRSKNQSIVFDLILGCFSPYLLNSLASRENYNPPIKHTNSCIILQNIFPWSSPSIFDSGKTQNTYEDDHLIYLFNVCPLNRVIHVKIWKTPRWEDNSAEIGVIDGGGGGKLGFGDEDELTEPNWRRENGDCRPYAAMVVARQLKWA